ncbi:MAG: hypothetical protein AB7V04_00460 [Desulfomonilaceae bacterium]
MIQIIYILFTIIIINPFNAFATSGVMGSDGKCYMVVSNQDYTAQYGNARPSSAADTHSLFPDQPPVKINMNARPSLMGKYNYVNINMVHAYYWDGTQWVIGTAGSPVTGATVTPWQVTTDIAATIQTNLASYNPVTSLPATPPDDFCKSDPCSSKADTPAGYNLATYPEGSSPNLSNQCFDGCQVTAEKGDDLGPCVNQSCAVAVIYTYSGSQCTDEETLSDLEENAPGLCHDQWRSLVNKCGSASKIGSFDWGSCSGECSKVDCSSEWSKLADRCGGESFIVNWDGSKCTGTCKTDEIPDVTNGDAPPKDITTTKTTNTDGSSTVTTTTTYNIDGTEYTTTNTTNYDADGNVTGTSSSSTQGTSDDSGDEESYSAIESTGFTEAYSPSDLEYDIPTRFTSFLTNVKSSGLFSFSSDFFNSLPTGGSSLYTIDGGNTYGTHTVDLSESLGGGLAVLKAVLLACFGFLSIRAVIMKR